MDLPPPTRMREELEGLSYAALRSAAQVYGIKSNQKAAALIEQILDPTARVYVRGKEPRVPATATQAGAHRKVSQPQGYQNIPEMPKAGPSKTYPSLSPLSPKLRNLPPAALSDIPLNNNFSSPQRQAQNDSSYDVRDALLASNQQSGSALLNSLASGEGVHFPTSMEDFVQTFSTEVLDAAAFRKNVQELSQKLEHAQARILNSSLIYEANRVANALVDLYIQEVQVKNVAAIYEVEDLRHRIAMAQKELTYRRSRSLSKSI